MYDIGIIGGGPGGYVAAIAAARRGASVALFEQARVGGVCLNSGCIPTKTLLKSANMLRAVQTAAAFGVYADNVRFDYSAVYARKQQVVERLAGGVEGLLQRAGVSVINAPAQIQACGVIGARGEIFEARNILLAPGSRPAAPPVPGIEFAKTSDDILELKALPASCAIIGGGVIGVEFAALFAGFGVPVTVVEMLPDILMQADADVRRAVRKTLAGLGAKVHTGARVLQVDKEGLTFGKGGQTTRIEAQLTLCAAGRIPNTDAAALERLGIRHRRGAIETDTRLRTSRRGIYAAGDANGKLMLAHKASAEGLAAVDNILGVPREINYGIVPSCVYTSPEAAWVGLSEEQARALGIPVRIGVFPVAANGKSLAEGETGGFIKLVAHEGGEILGGHMVCAHASDMIAEIALIMELEGLSEDLAHVIHPHPTVSEAVMEAAEAVCGRAIHI